MWCAAVRYGAQSEWNFAWNFTRRPHSQSAQRKKMLKAMCCTTDSTRVKQLLTRVLHPNIKQEPKDTSMIINRLITKNPSARSVTINFLLSNWGFFEKQWAIILLYLLYIKFIFVNKDNCLYHSVSSIHPGHWNCLRLPLNIVFRPKN